DVVMICASLSIGRTVLIPVLRLSRTAGRQLVSGSFFVGQLLRRRFYARNRAGAPSWEAMDANIGFFDGWMKAFSSCLLR
ncbi:hypothetical protein, partial [uncultured Herbaspirillum sp.]|uniref:hypothetical protein n=1 Tax=uncultured Herbaspirillum sp. TaxID=160236 RepID=UPI00258B0206